MQRLGRALMLPIAVLPVAGLLLRLGQPDVFNIKMIADAGDTIFSNLPLLFAIGVAVGFAKDNNGTAGLAGAIGYLIEIAVMKDEFGRRIVHTEKALYMTFRAGKLIEVNNQFAVAHEVRERRWL